MIPIMLASASPRRRALLASLGLTFEVVPGAAEERSHGAPAELVVANARAKRDDVAGRLDAPAVIVAADTLVFLEGQALGKPDDIAAARAMLARLSGKTHQVLTGLSLADTAAGTEAEGYESTDVTFRDLGPAEIDAFLAAVAPLDRAGAYTVDGPGALLVARYEGCYQNVLGFPLVRFDMLLRKLGYSLFKLMNAEKARFL